MDSPRKNAPTCLALIAALSWVLPGRAVADDIPRVKVRDVQLRAGGELQGEVVDAGGDVMPHEPVTIRQTGREIAHVRTDSNGRFLVRNLRGGLYEIATEQTAAAYRLWAPQTAPPAATDSVRIVSISTVYRGQSGRISPGIPRSAMIVGVGVVVAATIAIPIVFAAADDDDDPAS
jgi:hypothetical protein